TPSASLPPGLTLRDTGVLSGLPTKSGTFIFLVRITDSIGDTNSQVYSIAIAPGAATQYVVTAATSTVQAGTGVLIAVQVADSFGNPVTSLPGPSTVTIGVNPNSPSTSYPGTLAIGTNGMGLFLAKFTQVGSYTITATGPTLAGSTQVT